MMLKCLRLTAALSAAIMPFLPKVALGLPTVENINGSQTVIIYPANSYPRGIIYPNNSTTVIIDPVNSYPRGTVYPNNTSNPVLINPVYGYPGRALYPNNSNRVIVNPGSRRNNCSTTVIGSPIPSPVPINKYTGRFCQ